MEGPFAVTEDNDDDVGEESSAGCCCGSVDGTKISVVCVDDDVVLDA